MTQTEQGVSKSAIWRRRKQEVVPISALLPEESLIRLRNVEHVLNEMLKEVRSIIGDEIERIPDSPDGWASVRDAELVLGVSNSSARNFLVRNGAVQRGMSGRGTYEIPWTHLWRLLQDPTIKKPKPSPNQRGLVRNPYGMNGKPRSSYASSE